MVTPGTLLGHLFVVSMVRQVFHRNTLVAVPILNLMPTHQQGPVIIMMMSYQQALQVAREDQIVTQKLGNAVSQTIVSVKYQMGLNSTCAFLIKIRFFNNTQ